MINQFFVKIVTILAFLESLIVKPLVKNKKYLMVYSTLPDKIVIPF